MQPSSTPQVQRTHLRAYMFAAAAVPLAAAIQETLSIRASTAVIVARFAMAMIFFAAALPAGSRSPTIGIAAVRSALLLVILVGTVPLVVDGGSHGAWFWFLASVPLYVALVLHDRVTLAVTAGATLASGAVALMLQASPPGAETTVAWAVQSVTSIGFGAWGVHLHHRNLAFEAAARAALTLAEGERSHSARLATVGRMVAGVAHEINNPLAVIHANIAFLREDLASGTRSLPQADEADLLSDTAICAERIRRLVKDMQAFTRRESPFAVSSLADAVDASTRLARAGAAASVTIEVHSDGTKPQVAIERGRLEQALLNIYANGADAVRKARTRDPRIVVTFSTVGREARVRVQDNGPGIANDILLQVFEPFFTTKEPGEGPGLGLALAHEYISHVGGRITAANAPEGGAVFEIALPLAVTEPKTADSPDQFIES